MAGESTIKFSDPAKPGHLIVRLGLGDASISGADTDGVIIKSDQAPKSEEPRTGRFAPSRRRRGIILPRRKDNVITVTLASLMGGRHRDSSDVSITVPRNTRVTLERSGPGDTEVRDVTGDLEIRGAIGDIELGDVAGGVLVESVNGDINATFKQLVEGHPVSMTVVHGDVDLHLPADSKANVRFRTLRGEMLTDFSDQELQTHFENSNVFSNDDASSGDENIDRAKSVADQAKQRAKDLAEADKDRAKAENDRAKAMADEARVAAAAAAAQAQPPPHPPGVRVNVGTDVEVTVPPMPPMPSMPPMAGGKLVVGKLNGGGTDLIVTSITGDITLRKKE